MTPHIHERAVVATHGIAIPASHGVAVLATHGVAAHATHLFYDGQNVHHGRCGVCH